MIIHIAYYYEPVRGLKEMKHLSVQDLYRIQNGFLATDIPRHGLHAVLFGKQSRETGQTVPGNQRYLTCRQAGDAASAWPRSIP